MLRLELKSSSDAARKAIDGAYLAAQHYSAFRGHLRNVYRKTCGLIWALQLNLGIKFLQEPHVDWAGIECAAHLYRYKNFVKPGEVCLLIRIADRVDASGIAACRLSGIQADSPMNTCAISY